RLVFALAAIASLVLSVSVATIAPTAALAADYPSWSEVLKARNDEKKAKAEVARIERIIKGLETRVAETQKLAEEKADVWFEAQAAFDAADIRARELQSQADDALERAETSRKQAGQLAASL